MLGGLFNVHKLPEDPAAQCGEIDMKGLGLAQAMIFAVEKINNDSSLLPNISLGYDVRDYCENVSKAASLVYKLLKDESCTKLTQHDIGKNSITALIGPIESRTALVIGGFLQMLNVSGISGTTTSAELSSLTYSHLYRTVPSDTFLAKAMVDLVQYFNWGYVAVVGLDDSYGRNGVWSLVSEITSRKSPFCIAMTEFIRHETLFPSIANIVEKLKLQDNIRVVMLWIYGNYQNRFFAEVYRQNLTGRVWIISEVYLTSTSQENDPSFSILEGSIGFQHHSFKDFGFKEHLKNILSEERNTQIIPEWRDVKNEMWNFSESKNCDNCQTEENSNDFIEEIYSAFVPYTIDAVYSVAHALHISAQSFDSNYTNNREKSHIWNSYDIQKRLRRVNFEGLTGKVKFDRFGDRPSASYDIFNFKQVSEGSVKRLKKVLVGEWKTSNESETQLILYQEVRWKTPTGRPPKSECSEQCPQGTRKSITSPCCWQCLPCRSGTISPIPGSESCTECPSGAMSNQANTECVALPSANISYASVSGVLILAFGTIGVVVTLFFLVVICKFWNSSIVKASNRELSLALLLNILSLLSLAFINVFEPTDTICKIIYPVRYLTYNLCLSILLVKVLIVSSAFQVPIVAGLTISSLSNRIQVAIVIALQVALLVVLLPWLLLDPPFNMEHIYPKLYTFNECKAYASLVGKTLFLATCFYVFVQMLLSAFCAFKIRKVPDNFSEAKRIAFSLYIFLFSLLCYHPIELSMDGWYVTVVDCVTTLLVTYGFLCCIFLPKIYILLFRPELNNLSSIKQEVTQFSFGSRSVNIHPAFDSSNQEVQT